MSLADTKKDFVAGKTARGLASRKLYAEKAPGALRAAVLAALEAAQSIREQQITLLHPLEVVDFLAEEPSEFGVSCIGSRSWAGVLTESNLERCLPSNRPSVTSKCRSATSSPKAMSSCTS